MADATNAPADSSVGAAMAAQPGIAEAQKDAEKRAAADEKAYAKEQKDRESALRKASDDDDGGDALVESVRDPITGELLDSRTLNDASSKSDLARPAGAGMSDDERIRIANRHEDPAEVLAALRSGANPDDYRDPETDEVRTPSKGHSRSRASNRSSERSDERSEEGAPDGAPDGS